MINEKKLPEDVYSKSRTGNFFLNYLNFLLFH